MKPLFLFIFLLVVAPALAQDCNDTTTCNFNPDATGDSECGYFDACTDPLAQNYYEGNDYEGVCCDIYGANDLSTGAIEFNVDPTACNPFLMFYQS